MRETERREGRRDRQREGDVRKRRKERVVNKNIDGPHCSDEKREIKRERKRERA